MSSGLVVNGAGLDLGIDFHNTSTTSKSSKTNQQQQSSSALATNHIGSSRPSGMSGSGSDSLTHSGSGSTSSQATTVAAGAAPMSAYTLHEQSEKRFAKWLADIEQSLQFI